VPVLVLYSFRYCKLSVVLNLRHGIVSGRERHKAHVYENIQYKLLILIHHEKCTHWHFLSWFQIEHLYLCQDSKVETLFIVLYFLNTVQSEIFAHPGYYAEWHLTSADVSFTQWPKPEHVRFYGPWFHILWFLWTASVGFALDSTKLRLQKALLSVTLTFDLLPMTVVVLLSYKLLCPKAVFCLISVCDLDGLKEKLWEKKRTLLFISDNLKIIEKEKWRRNKAVYLWVWSWTFFLVTGENV
jgi:hypothetical protein